MSKDTAKELFEDIEPWPDPVDGAALLDEINDLIVSVVVLPKECATAVTFWVAMTYVHDSLETSPILALTSPEKRCGKTTLLTLLGRLVHRPLPTNNITSAALFRTTEKYSPTLLIDEADSFLATSDELRGIVNSGHTRAQAFVIRTVGDSHEPKMFTTWAPKAIAAIGSLPGTISDRSIEIGLERKLLSEKTLKLRERQIGADEVLRRRLARWAEDWWEHIESGDPTIPDALHDRAADNWCPLLSIADLVSGHWPTTARFAAEKLSSVVDSDTENIELLADIQSILSNEQRIFSAILVERLIGLDERPWATWYSGKPITAAWLAQKLRPFKIRSQSVRIDARTAKGYKLDAFERAFARYLPPIPPAQSVTASQVNTGGGFSRNENVTYDLSVTLTNPPKANNDAGCDVVTLPQGGTGGELDIDYDYNRIKFGE